jgi:short-subunit dehydrogenase
MASFLCRAALIFHLLGKDFDAVPVLRHHGGMQITPGMNVIVTGATGGLGCHMTAALAQRQVNFVLVAYPGVELEELYQQVLRTGCRAVTLALDLGHTASREQVVETARREFGGIDLLVNNAGVEFTEFYHELPLEKIREVLAVNLEAPMMLTRMVLPDMLRQRRGHVVNISSLARSGPAFQESYAATKAALLAFTMSLRASYRGSGVSASVICPGFVEAGIYTHLKNCAGCSAPPLLGTVPPQRVARAVLRAVENDRADLIINRYPVRPLLAFMALFPALGARLSACLGGDDFFRRVVQAKSTSPRH